MDAARSDHTTNSKPFFLSPKSSQASSRRGILTSASAFNSNTPHSHNLYGQESPESRPRAPPGSPNPNRSPKPPRTDPQAPLEAPQHPQSQPKLSPVFGKENGGLANWYSSSEQDSPPQGGGSVAVNTGTRSPTRKLSLASPLDPSENGTQSPQVSRETPGGGVGVVSQHGLSQSALKRHAPIHLCRNQAFWCDDLLGRNTMNTIEYVTMLS